MAFSSAAIASAGWGQSSVLAPLPNPDSQKPVEVTGQRLCAPEPTIGTRLAVRHKCPTPAEKQQMHQQARETAEEYKRRPCMAGTGTGENDEVMPC